MNALALDVGTVRVGCAWGNTSVGIAFPVAVWQRAQNRAQNSIISEIQTRKIDILVVGLPLGPSGERTPTCDNIESLVTRITKRIQIPVEFVDEAFSSADAAERLCAAGTTPDQLDAYAACLILESYFANNTRS